MLTTNKTGVTRFLECCIANDLTYVVCSPGSRNAPLVIALDNHPEIHTVVMPDERSAAFFALGMIQQLQQPVAVVCTSGSAMLNYYPAVAEAYYQGLPLVVLSADRPKEWVNHGDGQTIVQRGVYTNHIRAEVDVPEFLSPREIKRFDSIINEAFQSTCIGKTWTGPIHFNFPFSEPLYETMEVVREPVVLGNTERVLDSSYVEELREVWNNSEKRMILCGQMPPNSGILNALVDIAEDASVVVLVENTSNMVHHKFVHCIDRTLSGIQADIDSFRPDLLITLGGAIISKRIKAFLRDSPIKNHWKVGFDFPEMDTYRKLTKSVQVDPLSFLKNLRTVNETMHVTQFGWKWKQKDFLIQERLPEFTSAAEFSDLKVTELILDSVPDRAKLHMANSSVVRYCQLFDPIRFIEYYANRGTSGIDGSSSTAAGASYVDSNKLHVLITGDLSFFYDSNAFWNNSVSGNLKIIVVNNGGGGIFRIIDGPNKTPQLEHYFETENKASVEGICQAFHLNYSKAESTEEVETALANLFSDMTSDRPTVLEIVTPTKDNDRVLKGFFNHFKSI